VLWVSIPAEFVAMLWVSIPAEFVASAKGGQLVMTQQLLQDASSEPLARPYRGERPWPAFAGTGPGQGACAEGRTTLAEILMTQQLRKGRCVYKAPSLDCGTEQLFSCPTPSPMPVPLFPLAVSLE
jgi:hypothetical protein